MKKRVGLIWLAIILLAVYLRALFLQGLWHGDAFLYKQKNGSFVGSDAYAAYTMTIQDAVYGTDIDFSVNEIVNRYQIKYDENDLSREVEVLENGTTICKGTAVGIENDWIVIDKETGSSDMITVRVGNEVPTEAELFPNYSKLYNWAVSDKNDTRGNPYILFIALIFGVWLFLDVRFPLLFWILEHRLEVDGGEPSDWYLFGQQVGRVMLLIGFLVCMVLAFTLH